MILFLIMAGLELDLRINRAIFFWKLQMASSPAQLEKTISVTFDFRTSLDCSASAAGKMSEGNYGIAVTPNTIGL